MRPRIYGRKQTKRRPGKRKDLRYPKEKGKMVVPVPSSINEQDLFRGGGVAVTADRYEQGQGKAGMSESNAIWVDFLPGATFTFSLAFRRNPDEIPHQLHRHGGTTPCRQKKPRFEAVPCQTRRETNFKTIIFFSPTRRSNRLLVNSIVERMA